MMEMVCKKLDSDTLHFIGGIIFIIGFFGTWFLLIYVFIATLWENYVDPLIKHWPLRLPPEVQALIFFSTIMAIGFTLMAIAIKIEKKEGEKRSG